MLEKIVKNKIWITLILIVVVGIFLRTYNFSEWLRFNADQSRDVAVSEEAIRENKLPLLGPRAGGTDFNLGPFFYYFQIASMKIFSASPAAAAYPDLFFGTASIILFFFLARIFFKDKISLGLTFIFAISYFTIKYSRFAWNPNTTPFFVMLYLYSLWKFGAVEEKKKILWAIIAGIALGIGVQLHTSLLILLPLFTLISFRFLLKGKWIKKSYLIVILLAAFVVNTGQIVNEIETKGGNTREFFIGSVEKSGRNSDWAENLLLDFSCHVKANHHIIGSLGDRDECNYNDVLKNFKKLDSKKVSLLDKGIFLALFTLSVIFSLGGYFLLFFSLKKENIPSKKLFLKLILAYVSLFFLLSIVWATELSIRFFLPLAFVPFFLLGFWIKFLGEKIKKEWLALTLLIAVAAVLNFQKLSMVYKDLKNGGREIGGDFEYMTLGEGKYVIDFICQNSDSSEIYLDAQGGYLFKIIKPLQFLAEEKEIKLIQVEKEVKLETNDRIFYIRNADSHCELPESLSPKYKNLKCSSYRQFSVFLLEVR